MDLYEVIDRVASLLQQRGRLTYRTLKLQFELNDEQLAALKEELIEGQQVAVDEGSKVLVWVGTAPTRSPEARVPSVPQSPALEPRPPVNYTPQHLAERIRAVA